MTTRSPGYLLMAVLMASPAAADDGRSVAGRWRSEALSEQAGRIGAVYLIDGALAFWGRDDAGGDWSLFHARGNEKARVLYRDGQELSEPDGVAKRIMRVEDAVVRQMDRFYLACRKAPLRKARTCYAGRDPVPGIGEEAVYVHEDGQLRRVLGPGDVPIAGRAPVTDASILDTSDRGALVELRRAEEKHQSFVLAHRSGTHLILDEGAPLAGHPEVQVTAVWSSARLAGDAMVAVVDVTGAPFKRAIYRFRHGTAAEKIVAEGETPPGGRPISRLGDFMTSGDTIALVAPTQGGPEGLVRHHAGRLEWGGDVKGLRAAVIARGRPDVVLLAGPASREKPVRVLHFGSGPQGEAVFDVPKELRDAPFKLKAAESGGGVHVSGGLLVARLEPGRSPFDTAANWYLDFGDPGRVVRGPVFETDAGPVSALDVIHWPRPDEVLVASRGGIRRLTRLP